MSLQHSIPVVLDGPNTLALAWPGRIHWESPAALVLLAIPLILLVMMVVRRRSVPRAGLPLSLEQLSGRPPRSVRQRLLWIPKVMFLASVVCLILALARPQLGEGRVVTSTDAIAIQMVVDRSGSMGRQMMLQGAPMSRIDVVKSVLKDFLLGNSRDLAGRANDLIGLVTFARFAETSCPLVRDHRAVVELAQSLQIAQQRYEDGTAIGDGLALAAARLRTAEDDLKNRRGLTQGEDFQIKSKIIVLLTDGDNNAGDKDPIDSAKLCAEWGIKVYTIGIGGGGFQIIRTPYGQERLPIPDEIDERTLKRIAEITGGVYRKAQDGEALRNIYAEIDALERSSVKTIDYVEYKELFPALGVAALALLILRACLEASVLRRTMS